ncbi:MAG TPA: isocitrate lyase/phosphoenolpyruvate mutase family protein [Nocardioides sp.]|uniref:isocitrate lyase/PEP mutase family protein n=1 Tax=Nocardioides sp. TaxID=35761 RepID=UPI002E30FE52|nr:isocitrate lyase/phosphoenolpyruvate mutase family protein [Nocardioides sp.]HEX3931207.1 isocitrate lyase/phosphoenolpyruvate mutase family protein [Nocardioides sp.]
MDSTFAGLHDGPLPLLLPNAWDLASALGFLEAGYPAIGTTSQGVASSLGRPDASRSTRDANLALARALGRLPVPVSIDIEDGYDDEPAGVASYAAQVAASGVAGVNLEDSRDGRLLEPSALAGKLAAVKERAPQLFVNARVDTYWFGQEDTVAGTLSRARAYVAAGADCVFVPGLSDPDSIREITGALTVPVNLLPVPGLTLHDLAGLGVRRVSTGSLPYRTALAAAVATANAVRDGQPLADAVTYADLQSRLTRYVGR